MGAKVIRDEEKNRKKEAEGEDIINREIEMERERERDN